MSNIIHKSGHAYFSGLKGQYNSAQGVVSGGTIRNAALGKGCRRKSVRADSMKRQKIPSDGIVRHRFLETQGHLSRPK